MAAREQKMLNGLVLPPKILFLPDLSSESTLTAFSISDSFLEHINVGCFPPTLRMLSISNSRLTKVPYCLRYLSNLTVLSLSNNAIMHIDYGILLQYPVINLF